MKIAHSHDLRTNCLINFKLGLFTVYVYGSDDGLHRFWGHESQEVKGHIVIVSKNSLLQVFNNQLANQPQFWLMQTLILVHSKKQSTHTGKYIS